MHADSYKHIGISLFTVGMCAPSLKSRAVRHGKSWGLARSPLLRNMSASLPSLQAHLPARSLHTLVLMCTPPRRLWRGQAAVCPLSQGHWALSRGHWAGIRARHGHPAVTGQVTGCLWTFPGCTVRQPGPLGQVRLGIPSFSDFRRTVVLYMVCIWWHPHRALGSIPKSNTEYFHRETWDIFKDHN